MELYRYVRSTEHKILLLLFFRFITFLKQYTCDEFREKLIPLPEISVLMLSPLRSQVTMWTLEAHGKGICLNLILSKTEVVESIRLSSELGLIASHLQGDEEGES